MSSIRFWQSAFLIAVVALLVGAGVAFGFSSFLTIVGFIAVAIAVVNGLLGNAASHGDGPVLSVLKNLLNVGRFLKLATVTVVLTALCLAVYGGFARYSDYKERQKISIEGLVLTAAGDPADKATVSLHLAQGILQAVTSNGRFIFSKIDFGDEPTRKIKLEAHLGSREGFSEIDLSQGPPKSLVIKLSPGDPPFRITFSPGQVRRAVGGKTGRATVHRPQ
jgi:uncharacterized membrane protein